jgi:endonuclease G
MNRKYLYPIIIILVTAILYFVEKYVDRENEDYPETAGTKTKYHEFDTSFLPASTTGVIVNHSSFSLSYSEAHEQAEWVAYELRKEHLSRNDFERPYFIQDRSISSVSADYRNYKNSGYDRGHLCPAGDRRYDYDAFHETFLTSNISPQDHDFNSGIWNRLEQKARYWASRYDGVYIVTGGILDDDLKRIGEEAVSVPEEFYKIILDSSNGNYKAIAFLIPNRPSEASIYEFVVSIDSIEARTGIDFFPNLVDSVELALESGSDLNAWGKK